MKLSISNIAWKQSDEKIVLQYLVQNGYKAIEIAPTKLVGENPYEKVKKGRAYADALFSNYGLVISSMQSIWYGKLENMFTSDEDRLKLLNYSKDAIKFAEAIGCKNLVFGCPKNRIINNDNDINKAVGFFRELGNYAAKHNTVFALEANPKIYGTNFMNTTNEVIDICRKVGSVGVGVNFDFGTLIQNEETIDICIDNINIINHIHISEPYLELIKARDVHKEFISILKSKGYNKYISIEMKEQDLKNVIKSIDYLREVSE